MSTSKGILPLRAKNDLSQDVFRKEEEDRYGHLSTAELRQMICQKCGTCDSKTGRAACLAKLRKLDDQPFRFMDLPNELRNIVYELLLTRNDEKKYQKCNYDIKLGDSIAHPSILGASKQINHEASGYLKDGVASYTRDYYGKLQPEREKVLPVRNVTIFLAHWCDLEYEEGQVADLILAHQSALTLKTLKIVLNTFCSARRKIDTAAITKLFSPLHGALPQTKVQLVGFGEMLEKTARVAIGHERCNDEHCSHCEWNVVQEARAVELPDEECKRAVPC